MAARYRKVQKHHQNWSLINAAPATDYYTLSASAAKTTAPYRESHPAIIPHAEVDAVAGLLILREGSPFRLYEDLMPVVRQRLTMSEESRPALSRYAKLRFDGVRQRWVILAPERVLAPDDIAVEVLQLCDGDRTVMQVIDILAETYTADRAEIASDVLSMLRALAEKGFLIEGRES